MSDSREHEATTIATTADEAVIDDLLVRTSRTFALAIPLLPEPTRREVTLAYLLFRIADTFEDASVAWQREQQIAALGSFCDLLRQPSEELARSLTPGWLEPEPSDHDGYIELVAETPRVMRSFLTLSEPAREAIAHHTIRTSELMAQFVERSNENGDLRRSSQQDLRDYCYAVAGIVGEMLCDLFVLSSETLIPVRSYLAERAAAFGEGLQLVNILKDSASDATEGRFYLPEGVSRSEVLELARSDLRRAAEYSLKIQQHKGPDGVVAFTALPVELARASLDRVESGGAGAKISRPEVFEIHDRVHRAIAEGRPALPL
jgi:farnesyl-diphosphate farnesyltransferase